MPNRDRGLWDVNTTYHELTGEVVQVEVTKDVAPPVAEPEMPEEDEPLGIVEEIGDALEPWKLDDDIVSI